MKGKVVASNAIGSGVDIAMRAMLHKHGLQDKRDYTVIEAPFPAIRAILAEKKADLVSAVLPFALDPQLRGIARPLFTSKDAVGISEFTMWTARKDFIAKNRAALVKLMEDALTILRWYLDPANHEGAVRHLRPRHQAAARAARLGVHREGLFPATATSCPISSPCSATSISPATSASSRRASTWPSSPTSAWCRRRRSG